MAELFNPTEVPTVPTLEIARWKARIDRMNMAITSNSRVSLGSFSDDGQIAWSLAEKALRGETWQGGEEYEDAIMYELKPGIAYGSVVGRATEEIEPIDDPGYRDETGQMSYQVGRIAAREGLTRLGIWQYEANDLTIPLGVVAALCFMRADIEEDIDRKLFERKDEIRVAANAITQAVRPRAFKVPVMNSNTDKNYNIVPVYTQAPWIKRDHYAPLGFDPDAPLNAWWQELKKDLGRIDEAATTGVSIGNS